MSLVHAFTACVISPVRQCYPWHRRELRKAGGGDTQLGLHWESATDHCPVFCPKAGESCRQWSKHWQILTEVRVVQDHSAHACWGRLNLQFKGTAQWVFVFLETGTFLKSLSLAVFRGFKATGHTVFSLLLFRYKKVFISRLFQEETVTPSLEGSCSDR